MVKIYTFPNELKNEITHYSRLIDLYNEWKNLKNEQIIIDLSRTTYMEANIAAMLGAMFDKLTDLEYMNNIFIASDINKDVQNILQKNNFLSYFGYERIEDTFDTTVEFRKIKSDNVKEFTEYLDKDLFTPNRFPDMPFPLRKSLISSLSEIFINANMHSGCEYVYTCGQYFPKDNRLDFSIVNIGTTIKENVSNFYSSFSNETLIITSTNAINWAVKENTTTKTDESGGFGLYKTKNFIDKNKGKLFIISDDGCWKSHNCGNINLHRLPTSFDGTMVNFEINMNDEYNYDII